MCFFFTDPHLIIDEPESQSTNLNMDKKGDTLSEKEASTNRQRYEPRNFKDLTGHTFGTIPPDFKPVLTIPWTERPDQGISEIAADLTIIERFTTVTQSEQSITTSIPRRLTPGTEIEIFTIIDGTKFIPPSSTSDLTSPSQESEKTSLDETTTELSSLSTKTTLFASPSNESSEESSWTTSYTTDLSTEFLPPSSRPSPAENETDGNLHMESNMNCNLNHDMNLDMNLDMNRDLNRSMYHNFGHQVIYLSRSATTMQRYSHSKRFRTMGGKLEDLKDSRTQGLKATLINNPPMPLPVFDLFSSLHEPMPNSPIVQIMEDQVISASHGTDPSSKNHHNDPRELVDLTGSVYSTIPFGFEPVFTFASEDLPGIDREDVTAIYKVDSTSTKDGVIVIGTETWEPFTWYTRHKQETFTLVLRPTETTSSDNDILSIISHLTLPGATPTTLSEELTSNPSVSESFAIPTAESSDGSLSTGLWAFIFVMTVFILVLPIIAIVALVLRSRSRHIQNNLDIPLDDAPFGHTYTEPVQPVEPVPAILKS
ncbi:hypothetical protein F52700_1023 [Fusarium sp. NRRL 52700]|nr:hypothetical protein F52700_1023 [Fusarium sp. NRRL 52700]